MPSLTNILLHSIAYMAEKFPDKWMEKIPYYRAREEEMEEEQREARRRARKEKRSHSHSHKRSGSHRRSRHYEDDEDSDSYEEDYDRRDRRRHRSLDGRRQQGDERSAYRKSYNPADYAPVDRHGYAVQPPVGARSGVNRGVPGVTPTMTSFADDYHPTSTSGPIPGYVPYAHVYNRSAQSQHAPHGRDSRDTPHGSSDQYDRRGYRAEPRGGRYYDERDYDSEDDSKYRRRRSHYD
ncbi:hypothetical protein E4T44_14475 [Aureobasidium sp. EXF-8845]|nr:hypothetical protein E4T45_14331 [Aureobasidium sp. EXF-8846]KAI4767691.1 hypothetical protein E4T44_14475 [Aureobasidium sp. EXF-8845]